MPKPPTVMMPDFTLGALDWQQHSVCQYEAPALFDEFHATPREADWQRVEHAQKICRECPVKTDCLAFGIQEHSSGVFGGQYLSHGHTVDVPDRPYAQRCEIP